jgi:SM-20-related protein
VAEYELEMVAHGHGAFFARHIDTFTGSTRAKWNTDRLISLVFYFGLGPRRFTGGELVLHPFVPGAAPVAIEPEPNRLVAFPSFAPHEVRPVELAEDSFENARFAVNCWLHRSAQ